jgi:hypothetical protein
MIKKIIKINSNTYQVDTGLACFGVVTDNKGKIIFTAPYGRYLLGKNIKDVGSKIYER